MSINRGAAAKCMTIYCGDKNYRKYNDFFSLTKHRGWCSLCSDMKIQYCDESLIQSGGGT